MKMELQESSWCFTDGWAQFVNDNQLVNGDIILWEYIRKGLFSFHILELPSSCGKIVFGPFRFCHNTSENEDNIGGSGKRGREFEDPEENEEENGPRGRKLRLRQREQWLGTEIFAAGLAPRPTNPYFVVKLKSIQRRELCVPRHILKKHNLEFPRVMNIVDPCGRIFVLHRSNKWENGDDDDSRAYYSGGWKVLCRSNLLNPGDHCIVQFVTEAATGKLEARVSFVRANI